MVARTPLVIGSDGNAQQAQAADTVQLPGAPALTFYGNNTAATAPAVPLTVDQSQVAMNINGNACASFLIMN
jgi:hypothetical protein